MIPTSQRYLSWCSNDNLGLSQAIQQNIPAHLVRCSRGDHDTSGDLMPPMFIGYVLLLLARRATRLIHVEKDYANGAPELFG
jgi:hypothetical protein